MFGKPSKIRRRILLPLLGLALMALFGFGVVSMKGMQNLGDFAKTSSTGLGEEAIRISKDSLEKLTEEGILRIASDQAALIDAEFEKVESITKTLTHYAANLWENEKNLSARKSNNKKKPKDLKTASVTVLAPRDLDDDVKKDIRITAYMDDVFVPVMTNNPNIIVIGIGMPSGAYRRIPWTDTFPAGYDARERGWYKDAVAAGGIAWTDLYVGAFYKELRITCYSPVYDKKGKFLAVISVSMEIGAINENIIHAHLNRKGMAYIVNKDFKLIVGEGLTAEGQGWKDKLKEDYFKFDSDNEKLKTITDDIAVGKSGVVKGVYDGRESLVAYAPVKSTKWAFLMIMPIEDVVAPVRPTEQALKNQVDTTTRLVNSHIKQTLLILSGIFVLLLFAVIPVAYMVANRIVAPILTLDEGARIVGEGNLDHKFDVHSGDEVEALARTFNKMTEDLKHYIEDLRETTAAKERIQSELKVAKEIQLGILPRIFPPFPDRTEFDVYALIDPAKDVGGDLYDFFFIDERRFCFLVGDVSGKGVPAALYMMTTKTLLKTEAVRATTPDEILSKVNEVLSAENKACMFATIFCAILDCQTGELMYSNAGHNPPLLYRGSEGWKYMSVPQGFMVGIMPGAEYRTEKITLSRDDVVFLYTDGVTEAENTEAAFYGTDRLLDTLSAKAGREVKEAIDDIRLDVREYSNGAVQSDDITMLVLKFRGK